MFTPASAYFMKDLSASVFVPVFFRSGRTLPRAGH
jgi:hypothetical protein